MDEIVKSQPDSAAWYCARTQPKHEHIAARNLKGRLGLEVFQPRIRLERATQRGLVRALEPLFPGYVFVRFCLQTQANDVRHTFGISNLVHFGNLTPTVPHSVISDLRDCFDSEDSLPARDSLAVGSEVLVIEGSFLGSRGVVVRNLSAKQRVQILIDFLGRTTVTELDRRSVSLEEQTMADLMPSLAAVAA